MGTFLFKGPCNKDYSILGSILGSPCLGQLNTIRYAKQWPFGVVLVLLGHCGTYLVV